MPKITRHGGPSDAGASGAGPDAPGTAARLEGEHGPELVDLPAGTKVDSAPDPDAGKDSAADCDSKSEKPSSALKPAARQSKPAAGKRNTRSKGS